ncbi:MAG: lycopene cyclase domain-containing protein [Methylacidiphilales bacterium]|nr:lycopene cyclase domain-containing protein [Candidatus Methylacidiphilales bacterium]
MTYLRFHFLFNLPLLIVLGAFNLAIPLAAGEATAAGFVLLAVVVFTAPWDNLAAKWGIWGFPREKYSFRIGYLPVEEYAFFLLQSANVMLAVRALLAFLPDWQTGIETGLNRWTPICLGASVIPWLIVAAQLRWLRRKSGPRVNYALHLAWFLPVIYLQWIIATPLFWEHAGLLALVTAAFGVYYTLADLTAIRAGTWFFDENQITGVKLGGILPWEEIAFFFLTSLLVAQSYLLLLPADLR